MLPKLAIRVLFCYSPEVLADTYESYEQLEEDNQTLCQITEGVFQQNITTYDVSVRYLDTVQVVNLQKQWGINHECLNGIKSHILVSCVLSNKFKLMFGNLPKDLLNLKSQYMATVMILQITMCDKDRLGIRGLANGVGIKSPQDAIILIGRTKGVLGFTTYELGEHLLAHEMGHLMGCRHTINLDKHAGNSHGHYIMGADNKLLHGTIMSYAENKILYYSNPNLFKYPPPYENVPCGIVGESEAYKTVNVNIQKLAGIF